MSKELYLNLLCPRVVPLALLLYIRCQYHQEFKVYMVVC